MRRATNFYSGMTGTQSNHLYSFAEFCAAYLFQWSDVLWPKTEQDLPALLTVAELLASNDLDNAETRDYLFKSKKGLTPKDREDLIKDLEKEKEEVESYYRDLPLARRVMANVSNIMTFDDHDVTDDWYLTGRWTKRVLANGLGETVIRNGLLAFAVFLAPRQP